MILTVLLVMLGMTCVGILHGEGLWNNALRLINVVTSGLLAFAYFEPLARQFESAAPSYRHVWEFVALWLIFAAASALLHVATEVLSHVKVRFPPILDGPLGVALSVWIGWVMIGFTLASLHVAPLPREFLMGNFKPEERMFFGTAPDRQWLAFVHRATSRALCRRAWQEGRQGEINPFDPAADFLVRHASRRAALEAQIAATGSVRVAP